MAAEAGAGQADGKPEVEHEDDEHFRTEDSSCRGGGGETPASLYTQATFGPAVAAGAFRLEGRKINEMEAIFYSNLSAAAAGRKDKLVALTFS